MLSVVLAALLVASNGPVAPVTPVVVTGPKTVTIYGDNELVCGNETGYGMVARTRTEVKRIARLYRAKGYTVTTVEVRAPNRMPEALRRTSESCKYDQ